MLHGTNWVDLMHWSYHIYCHIRLIPKFIRVCSTSSYTMYGKEVLARGGFGCSGNTAQALAKFCDLRKIPVQ